MDSLEWRAEQVTRTAWPALEERALDGWLLRLAPGVSRRVNSLNPTGSGAGNLDEVIRVAEPLFAGTGQPVLFRIPSFLEPAVDRRLDELGFSAEGDTITLYGDIAEIAKADPASDIECLTAPDDAWLTAMARLQEYEPPRAAIFRRIIGNLAVPAAFMRVNRDGNPPTPAALAYGALDAGLLCCEMVITDPRFRGQGHARRMMQALYGWAAGQGANGVCLQVVSDNHPALALYRGLGLTTELYRYHYRRAPEQSQTHKRHSPT